VAQGASQLFAATANFQDLAQKISGLEITDLRIGAYGTAASHLLPRILAALRTRQTGPALHLTEVETIDGLPMVRSGEIDLLIAHRYLPEDPRVAADDLIVTPLGREPMLLLAAAGMNGRTEPTFIDCFHQDWVAGALPAPDRYLLQRWASRMDFTPRVRFETPDCHTAISLVASGLAVGLVPATVARAWADDAAPVVIIDLPPNARPSREILAVTRTRYRPRVVVDLQSC